LLSFTYVYFFESGLFNGLRPIQTKKSFPASGFVRLAQACAVLPLSLRGKAHDKAPASIWRAKKTLAQVFSYFRLTPIGGAALGGVAGDPCTGWNGSIAQTPAIRRRLG
jgi:hypothetical protein